MSDKTEISKPENRKLIIRQTLDQLPLSRDQKVEAGNLQLNGNQQTQTVSGIKHDMSLKIRT